jgi:hypothetical protein
MVDPTKLHLLDFNNGNTYCFVVPMIVSVLVDYVLSTAFSTYGDNKYWLCLEELVGIQICGQIIAFLFTIAFRSSSSSSSSSSNASSSALCSIDIRRLYWMTTIGVYLIVVMGCYRIIRLVISNNIKQ